MEENKLTEIEAAVFKKLLRHLKSHTEIQNIDLMLTADFCRNCLAKWLTSEAEAQGVAIDYSAAQEIVYGMPYDEWKKRYQTEASPDKIRAYQERQQRKQEQNQ